MLKYSLGTGSKAFLCSFWPPYDERTDADEKGRSFNTRVRVINERPRKSVGEGILKNVGDSTPEFAQPTGAHDRTNKQERLSAIQQQIPRNRWVEEDGDWRFIARIRETDERTRKDVGDWTRNTARNDMCDLPTQAVVPLASRYPSPHRHSNEPGLLRQTPLLHSWGSLWHSSTSGKGKTKNFLERRKIVFIFVAKSSCLRYSNFSNQIWAVRKVKYWLLRSESIEYAVHAKQRERSQLWRAYPRT